MSRFKFLALLFTLLFVSTVKAETSFVVDTAWVVADHSWLADYHDMPEGGTNLKFPDEIPADAHWLGANVTDGNIYGTVMALPLKEPIKSEELFRLKLAENSVITTEFPKGFQIFQHDTHLFLASPEFSEDDIDALDCMTECWKELGKSHFGFIQYYPERTLLPTLPPEQEDENEFVKKVRKRSADNYQDGQFVGKIESEFWGLTATEEEYKAVYECQNVEGTPSSDNTDSPPFSLGGFIDTNCTAFRVPFGKEDIEKGYFSIKIGSTVIPLEERSVILPEERDQIPQEVRDELEHTYTSSAWFQYGGKELEEQDGYHLIKDGNIFVHYPKQQEDRPDEEDVLSNAELDKKNEEMARHFFPFLTNVRQSLLSLDWSQPIDLALSNEGNVYYLACAYPPAETPIDWSLAVQLLFTTIDGMNQIKPFMPLDSLFRMEAQNTPKTVAGLTCHRTKVLFFGEKGAVVYVHEPGIFYAAAYWGGSEEVADEQYETMQRHLEEKIIASRQGVAEKMKPPTTVLSSTADGMKFRLDYETQERGYRFTAYIVPDSFYNVVGLAQMCGINMPFLR